MRRILPVLSVAVLVLLPLSSCAPSDGFHAGRPITKEELASISAELFTTSDEPSSAVAEADRTPDSTVSSQETTTPNPNETVYWVKNGKVYHTDPDCHHLEGVRSVKESTRRTAETNGFRPCKDCAEE